MMNTENEKPLTSRGIEDFLRYLRETAMEYNVAEADEREANDETQDILHAVELDMAGGWNPSHTFNKLRSVRRKRRTAKETQETAKAVVEWINANQNTVKALERLLGDVRKAEQRIQNRTYAPRTGILNEQD